MARIETWLRCNLQSMVRVQELSGDLFTADNQANRIGVIVTDNNGQPVQLTGGIIGYIIRPDEATVVVNGSISSNRAWIDLPASAYAVKGPISIVIKNGNTTIGACHGYIKRSTTDRIIDPGHEVPSLSELLAEIANMRTATSAANTAAGAANSAAGAANTAATNANNKANVANTAAGAANSAATNANGAAGKINNMTVAASGLTAGSAPTVTVSDVNGHKHILFGIPKGDKGDPGKDFRIKKTFASIAQMEAYDPSQDQSEYKVLEFDYVMIDTGSVENPDTGKLYCYEPHEQTVWHYIGDLSGAQGIKGETGNGISSVQLNQDYTLTITFTDGNSVTTTSIRGASGNETIDDTAGIGDTDLVYSADKVVKMFRSEHEDLTSGNAEQVIGKVASTEKGAYLYRREMHLGNRCREKVVGGTIAWNQLVQNGNFANASGWNTNIISSFSVSNNEASFEYSSGNSNGLYKTVSVKTGNKYLFIADVKTSNITPFQLSANNISSSIKYISTNSTYQRVYNYYVFNATWTNLALYMNSGTPSGTVAYIKNVQLFDLTAMFGSVIADTLYGMGEEGVAWFRERFSKEYYAYDAGSLQSVQAAAKVIKDANNNTVHTYPFDTSIILRGIPKLDSNNRLYYDGDEYESSGKVTRKYGVKDLGTLDWYYNNETGHLDFYAAITGIKKGTENICCIKYEATTGTAVYANTKDKTIGVSGSYERVLIYDSAYTDAVTFKTAMSGVYLVYELATPTTESADPFTPIMSFDPAGTEEFTEWGTRDVAVPVGHITEYLTDQAKILNNIPLIEVEKESASVVTFSDGAEGLPLKELTVKVEPVQDLHGYENPWPGGAGKNKLPISSQYTHTNSSAYRVVTVTDMSEVQVGSTYYLSGTMQIDNYQEWYLFFSDTVFSKDTEVAIANSSDVISKLQEAGFGNNYLSRLSPSRTVVADGKYAYLLHFSATVTGSIAFSNVQLELGSSGTSWTPYSNICPISGWTGAKVTRTGGNLFDKTANRTNGSYINSLGDIVSSDGWNLTDYLPVEGSKKLYISGLIGSAPGICWYNASKQYIGGDDYNGRNRIEITLPINAKYIRASIYDSVIDTINILMADEFQITFPSSAGTVYGGTLTVNKDGTGSLVVDRKRIAINSLSWSKGTSVFYADDSEIEAIVSNGHEGISSAYPVFVENYNTFITRDIGIQIGNYDFSSTKRIIVRDTRYSTAGDFASAMGNETIVFTLATPIVYDLSPIEVTTLLGINNAWADTGNVSLTYRADTKKYIDAKIAELSAAITALGT